ncbi:hypothetical protein RclHR1_00130044 [Rhizophagus clarus]|uniref:Protein kinase domain-containing protein n=1 Tax=Rhizophagus clarus TaxID=94130 RepID=A0A2Z6Q8X8_9GLOM|nr:hypothetical protein RclHR1_00130044 [Rhizophagus clarus]
MGCVTSYLGSSSEEELSSTSETKILPSFPTTTSNASSDTASNTKVQFGICLNCSSPYVSYNWCRSCAFPGKEKWTTGNSSLDNFIIYTQEISPDYETYLEWIPYEQFTDIKEISKGGFSTIYEAIWTKGPKRNFDASNRQCRENLIGYYGISQNPKTGEYILVAKFANNLDIRTFIFTKYLIETRHSSIDDSRVCLIFDDLSVLIYSGFNVRDILGFVKACRMMIEKYNGSLIMLVHADEDVTQSSLDDELGQEILLKSLIYQSEYLLSVRGLGSGFSKDVSGEITIARGPRNQDKWFRPSTLHYKILDNNVQFFVKGFSQVVL